MVSSEIVFSDLAIAAFCGHCDHRDDPKLCSRTAQGEYIQRDLCLWSHRNGLRLEHVSQAQIRFETVNYTRTEIAALDEAIAKRK